MRKPCKSNFFRWHFFAPLFSSGLWDSKLFFVHFFRSGFFLFFFWFSLPASRKKKRSKWFLSSLKIFFSKVCLNKIFFSKVCLNKLATAIFFEIFWWPFLFWARNEPFSKVARKRKEILNWSENSFKKL